MAQLERKLDTTQPKVDGVERMLRSAVLYGDGKTHNVRGSLGGGSLGRSSLGQAKPGYKPFS